MKFLSEFMKGYKAAQSRDTGKRELVPLDRAGSRQLTPRNSDLPAARKEGPLPAPRDEPEVIEPLSGQHFDEVVRPGAPLKRFEMWCSRTGKPFLAVAERHGDTLYIIGNEKAGGEIATSGWSGGYNYFSIDAAPEWCCPWCGVREDPSHDFLRLLWECGEYQCGGPLHCAGSSRGMFLCACGMRARRGFMRGDVFKVYSYTGLRGASGYGLRESDIGDDDVVTYYALSKSAGTLLRRSSSWLPRRRR